MTQLLNIERLQRPTLTLQNSRRHDSMLPKDDTMGRRIDKRQSVVRMKHSSLSSRTAQSSQWMVFLRWARCRLDLLVGLLQVTMFSTNLNCAQLNYSYTALLKNNTILLLRNHRTVSLPRLAFPLDNQDGNDGHSDHHAGGDCGALAVSYDREQLREPS